VGFSTYEIIDEFNTENHRVPLDWILLLCRHTFVHFAFTPEYVIKTWSDITMHILLQQLLIPIYFVPAFPY
jgi:hypothetical protein